MSAFLQLARRGAGTDTGTSTSTSTEATAACRVHSLNVLRALFRCSALEDSVAPYVGPGLIVALQGFDNHSWMVTHSLLLRYIVLSTHCLPASFCSYLKFLSFSCTSLLFLLSWDCTEHCLGTLQFKHTSIINIDQAYRMFAKFPLAVLSSVGKLSFLFYLKAYTTFLSTLQRGVSDELKTNFLDIFPFLILSIV
jgi:hypothetical protein